MSSVLFDAPGPRARTRNAAYTVAFAVVLLGAAYLVYRGFEEKGQWNPALWTPFVTWSTWSQFLLPGLWATVVAAVISVLIALPIGFLLGIGRLSRLPWVKRPCAVVVEFFRSIPVLLLMVFAAELYNSYTGIDDDIRPLVAVVTGLVLYNGSVIAEIVRAGILSLPSGQREAAEALGLSPSQAMRLIQLPQAVTLMLPALVSQLVVVLKDTALGGQLTVGYTELLKSSGPITGNFANTIPTLIVVALLFIAMNFLLTSAASALQRRLSRSRRTPVDTDVPPPGLAAVGAGSAV